jgi:hypothetical protein
VNPIEVILVEPVSTAGQDIGLIYAEKRSGLTWPLLLTGVLSTMGGAVAVLLFGLYGFLISRAFFAAEAVALGWTVFWARLLRSRWPTGIRVDAAGIRIGDKRALRFATSESYSVFVCPWTVVRGIVLIEPPGLRGHSQQRPGAPAERSDRGPGWARWAGLLFRLLSPLTGGSLYLYVDPDAAGGPKAERVANVYPFGRPVTVWRAPVRRPRALRAALAQVPSCPPTDDHFGPGTPFPSAGSSQPA